MDGYVVTPVGPFPTTAGNQFNTFTTRQDVTLSTALGNTITTFPLPVILPYQLRVGSKIRIEAEGEFSTTGTPTLSIGTYIGTPNGTITTVIAENTAITTGSAAASWPWELHWKGKVVAVGTSGSVVGLGTLRYGTSLTAFTVVPIPSTLALRTITWDTTIARAIGICATYGTSNAANQIKVNDLGVFLQN